MATEYSTIQQHQPLRVPRNWNTQEKALIVQLDEVFDDIYRRFGRLRIEDMGKSFRKRFEDAEGAITEFEVDITGLKTRVSNAEGNITTLTVDVNGLGTRVSNAEGNITTLTVNVNGLGTRVSNAEGDITDLNVDVSGLTTRVTDAEGDIGALDVRAGNIELAVGNKYDKIAGITIDTNGIGMTGKNITLNAGSSVDIKAGGTFTVQSGQFSIDANGNASFGGNLAAPTGTLGGFTIGNDSLTANDFEINTSEKSITSGHWKLKSDGLIAQMEDSVIGKWDFGMGIYGASALRNPSGISIAGDVGGSDPTHPWQTLFFDFKRTDGVFTKSQLRMDRDDTYTVAIRVRELTSEEAVFGGGSLGAPGDRWGHIEVDTINYITMTQGSSREIKHGIRNMLSMGARLDLLKPVTFVYDEDTEERTRYGLIYEDTVETMPEICTGSEENKAINYIELIPMLLKEIQELRTRVSDLEGRN